ncbi:hypothetical protein HQQ81_10535 [Microbacteriaceae bacterium VKM Ac-2854]|nr:hypothetical protein [Microbacteriaceae bacterium VKM Ac-2854]
MTTGQDTQQRRSEQRWPVLIAIFVAIALNLFGQSVDTAPFRYVAVGMSILLLIPLFVVNPVRLNRETRWSRMLSIALAILLTVANQINVVDVVRLLIGGGSDAPSILLTALQVWVTNVVAYGLLFWEMDRGGPVARGTLPRKQLQKADFAFPQDDFGDASREVAESSSQKGDWRPSYIDYLYLSMTNMMAFSPTDTMPLTSRAKLLMSLEAFTGFILLALVISRAVNILA